jgi:hypothetical protein
MRCFNSDCMRVTGLVGGTLLTICILGVSLFYLSQQGFASY